jgi:hypothetical protein
MNDRSFQQVLDLHARRRAVDLTFSRLFLRVETLGEQIATHTKDTQDEIDGQEGILRRFRDLEDRLSALGVRVSAMQEETDDARAAVAPVRPLPPPMIGDPGSLSAAATTAMDTLLDAFAERSAAGDEIGAAQAWTLYQAAMHAAIQRKLERERRASAMRFDLQGKPIGHR